jgi:hypothetical protein
MDFIEDILRPWRLTGEVFGDRKLTDRGFVHAEFLP